MNQMLYWWNAFFVSRRSIVLLITVCCWLGECDLVLAAEAVPESPQLDVRELFEAGGVIGITILVLSVAMVALIVEHMISIRRGSLSPPRFAEKVHHLILQGEFQAASEACQESTSFLSRLISEGLAEVELGYSAVEKSLEDASTQQAAKLYRKIEYLSMIGTIAPMLGLLGTVWGMILAFMEFTVKANPQVAELAPGIYKALVTTLLGLGVAVPALASFAIFRIRIDELVAETSLMAEHIFANYKRSQAIRKKSAKRERSEAAGSQESQSQGRPAIPPVTIERGKTG